ncbi:unnamed protein product [Cunninghamella echinulata]
MNLRVYLNQVSPNQWELNKILEYAFEIHGQEKGIPEVERIYKTLKQIDKNIKEGKFKLSNSKTQNSSENVPSSFIQASNVELNNNGQIIGQINYSSNSQQKENNQDYNDNNYYQENDGYVHCEDNCIAKDYIAEDYEDNDSSFPSVDETPTRSTKAFINIKNNDVDNDISDEEKWFVDNFNVSDYLFEYRQKSIEVIRKYTTKEQSFSRLLSLNHIFFFPLNKDKSCVRLLEQQDLIYNELFFDVKCNEVSQDFCKKIFLWTFDILNALKLNNETLDEIMGNILLDVAVAKDQVLRNVVYTLIYLTRSLEEEVHLNSRGEDTFVHRYLSPYLENLYSGSRLGKKWASKQLESSTTTATKYLPDFTLFINICGLVFDLMVVEVKKPNDCRNIMDMPKIGAEMKNLLNELVNYKVESPVVVGLWVSGFFCKSYKMDLSYNGVYRLVQLDEFELPHTIDDITKSSTIISCFLKMKNIINNTITNLENASKRKLKIISNNTSNTNNTNSEKIPQKHWQRHSSEKVFRIPKKVSHIPKKRKLSGDDH